MAKETDFRTIEHIERLLDWRKEKFDKLSLEDQAEFDSTSLVNPYSDSRILYTAQDKEIQRILVGIDIDSSEILLAKELGNIDLVLSHHPLGQALANLHEVMELQCDVLNQYGVPINVAEGLMRERISEVARRASSGNHQQVVDTAKLLNFNLICLHTATDNLAARFLKEKIETANLERVSDLMKLLYGIKEYQEAIKISAGPKIFVGRADNRCGKIALTEITGGTEGSPKLYEKMAIAGIGTVIGMHMSEEGKKEAESANLNVVIAGHMSSDSLGMNLFLDELEKQRIEIVPCSGLIRVSRA
ncbi:Nif3-like dinuclear metal center hexameric protein [Candidatus Parcubacteria bacterium]|nr:Nif3-like dinuclear metal center hexameric protein [Candidatus Parcubacteria bacterium]